MQRVTLPCTLRWTGHPPVFGTGFGYLEYKPISTSQLPTTPPHRTVDSRYDVYTWLLAWLDRVVFTEDTQLPLPMDLSRHLDTLGYPAEPTQIGMVYTRMVQENPQRFEKKDVKYHGPKGKAAVGRVLIVKGNDVWCGVPELLHDLAFRQNLERLARHAGLTIPVYLRLLVEDAMREMEEQYP